MLWYVWQCSAGIHQAIAELVQESGYHSLFSSFRSRARWWRNAGVSAQVVGSGWSIPRLACREQLLRSPSLIKSVRHDTLSRADNCRQSKHQRANEFQTRYWSTGGWCYEPTNLHFVVGKQVFHLHCSHLIGGPDDVETYVV